MDVNNASINLHKKIKKTRFFPFQVPDFEIFAKVARFGKVLSFDSSPINRRRIEIYTTKPIREVIGQQKITINDTEYPLQILSTNPAAVSDVNRFIQLKPIPMANTLQPPPAHDSPLNICNILCDDILRIIFQDRQFNDTQLVEIGNVCRRFNGVAKDVFKKKYKGRVEHINGTTANQPVWLMNDLLRTFGASISYVDSRLFAGYQGIGFGLVTKYCMDIVKLECYPRTIIRLPGYKLPKLLELNLSNMYFTDPPSTSTFFQLNSQIEVLMLDDVTLPDGFGSLLKHLPNLRHLTLARNAARNHWRNFACFEQLRQLESLELRSLMLSDAVNILLAVRFARIPLKKLSLKGGYTDYNQIIDRLCGFTSIDELDVDTISDNSLMYIVRNMKELKQIICKSSNITIAGVRSALEQSSNLQKVRLNLARVNVQNVDNDIHAIDRLRTSRSIELKMNLIYGSEEDIPEEFGSVAMEHSLWLTLVIDNSTYYLLEEFTSKYSAILFEL